MPGRLLESLPWETVKRKLKEKGIAESIIEEPLKSTRTLLLTPDASDEDLKKVNDSLLEAGSSWRAKRRRNRPFVGEGWR